MTNAVSTVADPTSMRIKVDRRTGANRISIGDAHANRPARQLHVSERVVDRHAVARGDWKPAAVRRTVTVHDRLGGPLPDVPVSITAPADGEAPAVGDCGDPVRRQVQPREHPRDARRDVEAEHVGETVVMKNRNVDRDDRFPGDRVPGEIGNVRSSGRNDASYGIEVGGHRQLLAERHLRIDDFLTREIAQNDFRTTILRLAGLHMERREVSRLQMSRTGEKRTDGQRNRPSS